MRSLAAQHVWNVLTGTLHRLLRLNDPTDDHDLYEDTLAAWQECERIIGSIPTHARLSALTNRQRSALAAMALKEMH